MGHIAGQCDQPPQCHCCGSTSHVIGDCPNRDKTCSICGKVGHLKVKCRQADNKAARSAAAADKVCNNCGWKGHLAKDCPEPAQCHCCGSTSHAIADCPHRDKTCELCGKVGHLKRKCRQAYAEDSRPPLRSGKGSSKGGFSGGQGK